MREKQLPIRSILMGSAILFTCFFSIASSQVHDSDADPCSEITGEVEEIRLRLLGSDLSYTANPYRPDLNQIGDFRDTFFGKPFTIGSEASRSHIPGPLDNYSFEIEAPNGSFFTRDSSPEDVFYGVVAINTDENQAVSCTEELGAISPRVNFMDIDVSKIIVISINTARGGSAIATSEIFIQPVQNNTASPSDTSQFP
jgi:hypothetical protein